MELQRVWQRLFSFFFQSHCESVVPDNYVKQTRRWHSGLICFFVFFPDEQIDRKLRERWDLAAAVSLLASSDASAAAMSRGWEEGGGERRRRERERERENIINRMWWCQTGSERWQRFAERRETMCRAAIQLSAVKTTRHQEVFRPRWRKTSAVLRTSPRFKNLRSFRRPLQINVFIFYPRSRRRSNVWRKSWILMFTISINTRW